MDSPDSILVFDFDGVLCHSLLDSLITALNTYIECVPDAALPFNRPLNADSMEGFEQTHAGLFDEFSRLMPMGNFAEDYFVMLHLLDTQTSRSVENQEDFRRVKRRIPDRALQMFRDRFYSLRRKRQEEDPAAWARMLPPFPGIVSTVKRLSRHFILGIATSKDRISVSILLENYGLIACFRPGDIHDKDFAPSKREHLKRFQHDHGIPFGRIHFIDDKVLHLTAVKTLGVIPYLALWGYNTVREQSIAQEQGIHLLSLNDLASIRP
jgi:phosphoglycolate phosphatase-like HAD superfamily hydrolase